MGKSISERLMLVIKHLNLNTTAFAEKIGVSQPLLFNYTKNRQPSVKVIEKILIQYPEISADWLITGRGEMKRNTEYNNIKDVSGIALQGGIYDSKDLHFTQNSSQVKDELIAEKGRIIQYQDSFINAMDLFRMELHKFHEIQTEKDSYIERIIKNSYERNEENMRRIDELIRQNAQLIEQAINIVDYIVKK
ncbi:MAG: helix-turn-helix domain-containing protein [Prevotellaceae bacterium]|jgi:hypothetical protein|nr:helix-turn-helix domain-containing protein [Prevotellaceae bacterium]